jgi:putative PIN family toxin of toxin-antitoxin system
MIITLDTNLIFSALYSNLGASHYILRLVLTEQVTLALSPPVYFEYDDVLTRPDTLTKLNLSVTQVENILDTLALLARKHAVYFLLRPNLPAEKDNLICECAFASRSEFLITANLKDFQRGELTELGFKVVTPKRVF